MPLQLIAAVSTNEIDFFSPQITLSTGNYHKTILYQNFSEVILACFSILRPKGERLSSDPYALKYEPTDSLKNGFTCSNGIFYFY